MASVSELDVELKIARKKLMDTLGDDCTQYFQHLKNWFRGKVTKEEFDLEARKLFSPDVVHLHNEFLLAMLNKVQVYNSFHITTPTKEIVVKRQSPVQAKSKRAKTKKKGKAGKLGLDTRFQRAEILDYLPMLQANDPKEKEQLYFCSRDSLLPNVSMLHGRMYVVAWEYGLDGVDDKAIELIVTAMQQFLKSVVTAVLSRRNGYKLREGQFLHSLGASVPNPWLRNTVHLSRVSQDSCPSDSDGGSSSPTKSHLDNPEHRAAFEVACGSVRNMAKYPVSLYDLLDALQVHKDVIPVQPLHSLTVERILAQLWHPSREELPQEMCKP